MAEGVLKSIIYTIPTWSSKFLLERITSLVRVADVTWVMSPDMIGNKDLSNPKVHSNTQKAIPAFVF